MKTFVAIVLFSVSMGASAQARHFAADDLPKIVRVGDPQVSPDGKTIAFTVGRANLKEDRWDSEIDFVDVATKRVMVMTHDRMGVGSPRWSPSGDRLAFVAQDSAKKAQIYLLPMGGGDAVQLTRSKTSVSGMAWRPDGAALAFTAPDDEVEKKDEAKFDDAFEVGDGDFLQRSAAVPVHLWVVTADGEMKRLTSGTWSVPNHLPGSSPKIAFTPDGGSLLFERADTAHTGDSATARLMVLTVASGAVRPLTKAANEETNLALAPDGTKVAYFSLREGKRGNDTSLFVAPVAGGARTDVTFALDRSLSGAEWMPDGGSLLVEAPDHTKNAMWIQTLGGKATRLEFGGLNPAAMTVGRRGELAFTATSSDRPAELYYAAKATDAPVQMTHLQTVTVGLTLGKSETVQWKVDSFDESGVLTYPPDYKVGKKYAMVLYIHGGPKSASMDTFTPSAQILAGKGWLVFEPNYRGSDSDGNAYESAIVHDAGIGPGRDVMAGVKMLETRGIVDEKRIAVSGWSYGGYMTSWLIGNYPDVWKAAVAGAPVTDLVEEYTLSDVQWLSSDIFGPSPYVGDNLKLYQSESPITYASKMKTPTLVLCDVGDYRVPIPEAYKLYHALKDNGVPVKFVAYPVLGHSPADPIRARDIWRRWTAWLEPYLKD